MTYPLDQQLEDAAQNVRWLSEEHNTEIARRDRLVLSALKRGWTHARISELTGLSRGRIGQLAQAREWRDKQTNGRKT